MTGWREGNIANLRHAALWYGYGQSDAGNRYVDANAFAAYYAGLATEFEDNIKFFLPSIQQAWQDYTEREES